MDSSPAGFFIGLGVITLFIAICICAVIYISLAKHGWPLLTGRVVWIGVKDPLYEQGSQEYVASPPSMNVVVMRVGRPLELSFPNASNDIKVNDIIQLRVHPVFPRLFNSLDVDGVQSLVKRLFHCSFGVIAVLLLGYLGFILLGSVWVDSQT